MISYTQALILGLLQGVTELFPISSLGHGIIIPSLLGWHIDQGSDFFLDFLIAVHLGTALVLLGFYFRDWVNIVSGFFRSLTKAREGDMYAKLAWLIIASTIPAGLLGLLFQTKLQNFFASPLTVSVFLIGNGILLWLMESFKRRMTYVAAASDEHISRLSWGQAIKIGLAQCLGLLPGFSRTGSTFGGGLLSGLNHEDAMRYSFLLATPIILAAAVLKLPRLAKSGLITSGPIIIGALTSAIAAYVSLKFLTTYFEKENRNLIPFAIYCMAFGFISLLILR